VIKAIARGGEEDDDGTRVRPNLLLYWETLF
jgi:hypothetical protein